MKWCNNWNWRAWRFATLTAPGSTLGSISKVWLPCILALVMGLRSFRLGFYALWLPRRLLQFITFAQVTLMGWSYSCSQVEQMDCHQQCFSSVSSSAMVSHPHSTHEHQRDMLWVPRPEQLPWSKMVCTGLWWWGNTCNLIVKCEFLIQISNLVLFYSLGKYTFCSVLCAKKIWDCMRIGSQPCH